MKTILFFISLATLLGCTNPSNESLENFTFLIDRTEENAQYPTGSFLLNHLPERNPEDGIGLCFATIGDTPYLKSQCFLLEAGETGLMANESTRRKQNRLLKTQFTDSLSKENAKEYFFEHSAIFKTVVTELEKLTVKEGGKELWVFSDLMEHSFFSAYDPKHKYKLLHNLEEVVALFEKEASIKNDFSDIKIRIIHSPTLENSKLFSQLVLLYRKILEPRGAVIEIGIENQIRISK